MTGPSRPAARAQFGTQSRADAARRMILLGVSQGIQSLPPTNAQSFAYEFDFDLNSYVATGRLGPVMSRSAYTIGKGKLSTRLAGSYFSLSEDFGTIPYSLRPRRGGTNLPGELFTRLGLDVEARVGVLGFALGYGVLDRLELGLSVPLTIVKAEANNIATFLADDPNLFAAARSIEQLDAAIADGRLVLRTDPVGALGAQFNDSTGVGVGQIGLVSKYALLSEEEFAIAAAFDLLFPSPSEDNYAGPDSFSLIPRAIFSAELFDDVTGHADVGYNYTVNFAELQALIWRGSISWALDAATVDVGAAGSYYNRGLVWTPSAFTQPPGSEVSVPLRLEAQGNNTLGVNYVDFFFGAKLRITDRSVVSGGLTVPVNDEGFRPDVLGTVAFEAYF